MWKVRGVPFLNYSKCIWDKNTVNDSHNCHGLKRVAQGQVSNGVERVSFWKSQPSPWGCVLQSEPPGAYYSSKIQELFMKDVKGNYHDTFMALPVKCRSTSSFTDKFRTHTVRMQSHMTTAVNQSPQVLIWYVMELLYKKVYSTETWPKMFILHSLSS